MLILYEIWLIASCEKQYPYYKADNVRQMIVW